MAHIAGSQRRVARGRLVISLLLVFVATTAVAQPAPSSGEPPKAAGSSGVRATDASGQVTIRATRVTTPIRIDGRLDEEVYREVPAITQMVQQVPVEGAPATEPTDAWVLFDDENIYISCRCGDANPRGIVANDMRRDSGNLSSHDHFGVGFDTFYDGRNGYQLYVTAAGGMRDGLITDERYAADWNGVWDAKAVRTNEGYIAELAIPFKTLRYGPGRNQTWHIQFRRFLARKNEMLFLTPVSPNWGLNAFNRFSAAPTLVDLEVPPPARNLELKPYAISRLTTDRLSRPAISNDIDSDAGVDLKYGITKGLIADLTYNTDFAQVEADEAQVNLTRFNLVFPEKREFFLENQGIFVFGSGPIDVGGGTVPTIFYSRRIGLTGARAVPVIGGGRVAGKSGPWSVGALSMTTDNDETAGVEQTNFTVLRLRHDILRRSAIGGIFTRRSASTVAQGSNEVWGFDANLAFYQNVYLNGYLAQSRTQGLSDQDLSYRTEFVYDADRYGFALDRIVVEDNFNPEVGFMRRQDFRRNFAQARFSPRTRNHPIVRRWLYQANFDYITDNHDVLESRRLSGQFQTEFHSSDRISVEYERQYERLTTPFAVARNVRIPVGGYEFDNLSLSYTAGARHRLSGTTSAEVGSFYDGDKKTAAFRGRVEITTQLSVEPNVSLNWISLPQADFTDAVVGGRAVFTVTPRMFMAALVQYSSSNTSLSTNLRFRWEYKPGSELFLVYTDGRSTLGTPGTVLENRGFVVKINRLFRF